MNGIQFDVMVIRIVYIPFILKSIYSNDIQQLDCK